MAFELGLEAQDKITGFTGILTGSAAYITGCNQYLITPKMKGDSILDGRWFDEGRIDVVGNGVLPSEVSAEKNGCDIPAPVK